MAASNFFPILGVLLSNALYFAPVPAVRLAVRRGALGTLNPLPHALMVISTFSWVCYALSKPDVFITLSNAPGCLVSLWYVTSILPLIPREAESARVQVQATILVGALCLLTLASFLVLAHETPAARSFSFGLFGSFVCILLFASPLSTVSEVLSTRNAASIYAPLTAAQVINCATWTIYGFTIGDIWVWGPNSTGLGLGLLQLMLKLSFPSTPFVETKRLVGKSCSDDEDMCPMDCSRA
ncbi:hypothetical protein AB1Y20_015186 [Prymnesium parvum]|uniref:Sugar transporter SWEET1 n=1 Tax=Prymnesium parvum TaxID=97485 RepID=A0AB34JX11_PRYPA